MHAERATVVESRRFGDAYVLLRLRVPRAHAARPGQFAMLRGDWGTEPLLGRPMSYLSGGEEPEFLLKIVGAGTSWLAAARTGDRMDVVGPLGNAFAPASPGRKQILVAGGVGVVPLFFHAARGDVEGASFLYGGRTADDLPLAEPLSALCDLRLATEDGSRGTKGRVTELLAGLLDARTDVLTCGPTPMMRAVAERSARAGARCFASLEAPMACGYGVCLGCVVKAQGGGFRYVCTDGPVIDATEIDWR